MKVGAVPLVIGNWKMNPGTSRAAVLLAKEVKKNLARCEGVEVALAPSFLHLSEVAKVLGSARGVGLAVQGISPEKEGPQTGVVSLSMVKEYGVRFVVVGHSEMRARGMSDDEVHAVIHAVVKAGLTPVLCVGERERDAQGRYLSFVEMQIRTALHQLSKNKLEKVVIAYEPVWAISRGDGKGKTATPEDAHEMTLFIEKILSEIYGRNYAKKVRILYGGSVNAKNAEALFREGGGNGFLVGGASLSSRDFTSIVRSVATLI